MPTETGCRSRVDRARARALRDADLDGHGRLAELVFAQLVFIVHRGSRQHEVTRI